MLASLRTGAEPPHSLCDDQPAEYNQHFSGRGVVILPDSVEARRDRGKGVAAKLRRVIRSVRIVELPELPLKGDVSEWLAQGHTRTN